MSCDLNQAAVRTLVKLTRSLHRLSAERHLSWCGIWTTAPAAARPGCHAGELGRQRASLEWLKGAFRVPEDRSGGGDQRRAQRSTRSPPLLFFVVFSLLAHSYAINEPRP